MKKSHTYDDHGNVIQIKQVKPGRLPNINYQNTKVLVSEATSIVTTELNKKIKLKARNNDPKTSDLTKELN